MRYLVFMPLLLVASVGMGSAESTAELSADSSVEANAVLEIGGRAPVFQPEKWLKGEPVDEFQDDSIYLIECWATWCGPCIASIPKLNELHQHFEKDGLVVIGANVLGDTHQKAQAFVARMGDRMAYRIAYDGELGNIARDWLKPAKAPGIPFAFMIRNGLVAWHGHPDELTVDNIRTMMEGGAFVAKSEEEINRERQIHATRQNARLEVLALLREKPENALDKIRENEALLAQIDPSDPDVLRGMAFSCQGQEAEALQHFRATAALAGDRAHAWFRVAYGLLDFGTVRDPDLALNCARKALELENAPQVRHLVARAEFAAGNRDKAIEMMTRLVKEDELPNYLEDLEKMKSGQSPSGESKR